MLVCPEWVLPLKLGGSSVEVWILVAHDTCFKYGVEDYALKGFSEDQILIQVQRDNVLSINRLFCTHPVIYLPLLLFW